MRLGKGLAQLVFCFEKTFIRTFHILGLKPAINDKIMIYPGRTTYSSLATNSYITPYCNVTIYLFCWY